MQDRDHDLLGLAAVECIVLMDVRGLNVARQIVSSLVLILLLLVQPRRVLARGSCYDLEVILREHGQRLRHVERLLLLVGRV